MIKGDLAPSNGTKYIGDNKMIKKILTQILLKLVIFGFDRLYNIVDKDRNGEISKDELLGAYDSLRNKMSDLNKSIKRHN